ncbi:UNVERIFIED_CONTAM: M23 family metallopeptidase [Halobacillus marinus]
MVWMLAPIYLLLPLALLFNLWKTDYAGRKLLVMEWLACLMFMSYIFFLGPWAIYNHYLRWLWPVLFLVVSFFVWRRYPGLPVKGPEKNKPYRFSMGISIALFLYFGVITAGALTGYRMPEQEKAVDLAFPMEDGVFTVGHGGASTAINYHHDVAPQAYANDITQLHWWGMRASGLSPENLKKYRIYGTPLYSPCSGEVTTAVDRYDDLPPQEDPDEEVSPAGNHVILSCDGTEVHLAHMKPGSVEVEEGQMVETGDRLGSVGNTGNTTEPHLHIHAERDGEGVPITFDGRFLKRNSLVFD